MTGSEYSLGGGPAAFDSVAAADTLCTQLAPGGRGEYAAWLSTTQQDAKDRVGEGPWCLLDARITPVFLNSAQLALGPNPGVAIDVTEVGESALASWRVWTGTNADGAKANNNCNDWDPASALMTTVGAPVGGPDWTSIATQSTCSSPYHLYCFEK